jgi:hypothetical protein
MAARHHIQLNEPIALFNVDITRPYFFYSIVDNGRYGAPSAIEHTAYSNSIAYRTARNLESFLFAVNDMHTAELALKTLSKETRPKHPSYYAPTLVPL